MAKPSDLCGKKFSRLTVIKKAGKTKANKTVYWCLCDCGMGIKVVGSSLVSGNTNSCGCLQRERTGAAAKVHSLKHGLSRHPLYTVWIDINRRCHDPRDTTYARYGARGISVCEEWRNDFMSFYFWAINNGWQKGLEIDRFPDNDGGYNPNNCRVTTRKKNCNNKGNNVLLEIDGVTKTAAEWAEQFGIHRSILARRIGLGIKGMEAIRGVGKGNKFSTNQNESK